jgi:hypothetical protein
MILDKTATIQIATSSNDNEGYNEITWSSVATVRVNRQPFEAAETMDTESGVSYSDILERFFTKPNTYIANGDKSTPTRIIESGDTFLILRVKKYNIHYEVICKLVKE